MHLSLLIVLVCVVAIVVLAVVLTRHRAPRAPHPFDDVRGGQQTPPDTARRPRRPNQQ